MRKFLSSILLLSLCSAALSYYDKAIAQQLQDTSFCKGIYTLKSSDVPVIPTPGGGGGGAGVAIGAGAGAAAAGLGAASFAPLLLAGLSPNSIIAAAAPIGCIPCQECFLQKAIMSHFCTDDICKANTVMSECNPCKLYFAQNNSRILNGTFDMQGITLPKNFIGAKELKVSVTLASDPYGARNGDPELELRMFKDITPTNLSTKFQTQQFLRGYLMRKYEVPLVRTVSGYPQGLQKLTGIIDMSDVKNKEMPLQVVMKYTDGGFQKNQAVKNPKVKMYAYLLEVDKIK
jgi:hypothetical protein